MLEIDELIKSAMKQRDKASLRVFKEIKSEIVKLKTAEKPVEYTAAVEIKLLKKFRDQHVESLKCSLEAGREDLAQQENEDLAIYDKLLPKPATPAEINGFLDSKGYKEIKKSAMSEVIKLLKEQFPANEGKQIATIVKYRIDNG